MFIYLVYTHIYLYIYIYVCIYIYLYIFFLYTYIHNYACVSFQVCLWAQEICFECDSRHVFGVRSILTNIIQKVVKPKLTSGECTWASYVQLNSFCETLGVSLEVCRNFDQYKISDKTKTRVWGVHSGFIYYTRTSDSFV